MLRKSEILGIAVLLATIPLFLEADAELWDLIIIADVENAPIFPGESPIVSGGIVNHASKPVAFAQVHIRSGQESIFTVTDENGQFRTTLSDFNRISGTYIVNIIGTAPDGKTGITTTEFQVKGDSSPEAILKEQLSTPEAIKYLEATEEDFVKNPIGLMLWKHYQKLNQEYIEKEAKNKQLTEEEIYIEEQKAIAEELRQKAIEERNPSFGIFSGDRYDRYVLELDPEIKDIITNQLNFTKNLFAEAQLTKQQILENGGTQEEAMNAYFEKISVSKQALESFGIETIEIQNDTSIMITNSTDNITEQEVQIEESEETTESEESEIKVDFDGKTIFVNVNGTTIEFIVNSTGVYQIK